MLFKSILYKKTFYTMEEFCNIVKITKISFNLIIKTFRIIRNKIRIYYHRFWSTNQLGIEPAENGKSRIEFDESKIIHN